MDTILTEMEFETLATGEFTASPQAVANAAENTNITILDVRTTIEHKHCEYPFATHIPLKQLPDRHAELPKDKMIITVGASAFQAAVAFFYLRQAGFEMVKTMVGGTDQLATELKPAGLYKKRTQGNGCGCSCAG